jgi:hypothetical protein
LELARGSETLATPQALTMVSRRGAPGDVWHTALRAQLAEEAARPTYREIAQVVVDRLGLLPDDVGISDVDPVIVPVEEWEHIAYPAVPVGTAIPAPVGRVVRLAKAGQVDELAALGLIGSAEQLAKLIPQMTARTFAAAFPDPDLSALMASLYQAFRVRGSLLLLNLPAPGAHQRTAVGRSACGGAHRNGARTVCRHAARARRSRALSRARQSRGVLHLGRLLGGSAWIGFLRGIESRVRRASR